MIFKERFPLTGRVNRMNTTISEFFDNAEDAQDWLIERTDTV